MSRSRLLPLGLVLLLTLAACGGPSFSGTRTDATIDDAVLSTRLDRKDLEGALDTWYAAFESDPYIAEIPEDRRTLAILQIRNRTSEYIGGTLEALIQSFETRVVNGRHFKVVAQDELVRDAILAEQLRSTDPGVDPATVAQLGKAFGVHYFVHGNVRDQVEVTADVKRVQYFLTLSVTSVEESLRVFQLEVPITKQVED